MNSVSYLSSSDALEGLLALAKCGEPILDTTYGNGVFWDGSVRHFIGMDIDLARAKHLAADFQHLPFASNSIPTVVFDPPFHPFVHSVEETRFKGMGHNERELRALFEGGLRECWRVAARHLIVKCQGFVHNHAPQWMPLWAISCLGEPFEWLIVAREHKRISGRWVNHLSLRRNHADYLLFDKRGNKR